MEPITQILGQVHKLGHPRSRSMISIVNGCYNALKHLDGELHKLGNTTGTMISKKSSLQILDRCASGMNKVMMYILPGVVNKFLPVRRCSPWPRPFRICGWNTLTVLCEGRHWHFRTLVSPSLLTTWDGYVKLLNVGKRLHTFFFSSSAPDTWTGC